MCIFNVKSFVIVQMNLFLYYLKLYTSFVTFYIYLICKKFVFFKSVDMHLHKICNYYRNCIMTEKRTIVKFRKDLSEETL